MTHIHLTTGDLMVYKDWKIDYHFLLITRIINCKVYDFTFFLVYHPTIPPSTTVLFRRLLQASFLTVFSVSFWLCTLLSNTFCCASSLKHSAYTGIFFSNLLSWYLRSLLPATTVTISYIFNFLNSIRFWKLSLYLEKVIIIWIT